MMEDKQNEEGVNFGQSASAEVSEDKGSVSVGSVTVNAEIVSTDESVSEDTGNQAAEAEENPEEPPKKTTSIKVNFAFNLMNKLVAVLVPLLITPYLARVLEPDGNGVISFVGSISSYFVLVANLGIETYGQRVIAIHRNDKAYLKKFFIEISILRFLITAACLAVYYVVFGCIVDTGNKFLYLIYGLTILAVVFDFSWFFQGVEDFKILAFASVISRLAYVACVFVFVRAKSDLLLAAGFAIASNALPFLIGIPFIAKYIGGKIEGKLKPFSHFKECMVYFIPTIAIQIYTVLDKTMIGIITRSDFENGYYEQAEKLVKLTLTVTTILYVIVRSRISYHFSRGEMEQIDDLIDKSTNFTYAFSLPAMFGMVAVAPKLVPIYLGAGYEKCVLLIYVLSPLIILIALSGMIGSTYYTPFNKQKTSNWFLITGALVNFALNTVLIYFFKSVGAAIASICAEFVVTTLYMVFARKVVSVKRLLKTSIKYLIASIVMFACVMVMDHFLPSSVWYLLLEVGAGIVIYFIMLLVLRTKFILDYIKNFVKKLSAKFKRKK